jgi:hypothetical protein
MAPFEKQQLITMALPVPATQANGSNVWQYYHYMSASSQAAFPQSQDRHICSTCNKAFSRPSSVRIHSHSPELQNFFNAEAEAWYV